MLLEKIKNNPRLGIVIGITMVTLLWMALGIFNPKEKPESANIVNESSVKSIASQSEIRTRYLSFTGIVMAHNGVNLIPQTTGIVVKKFAKDGGKLKAGDKIIQIRNDALLKRVENMENALHSAKLRYESALKLSKNKLGSDLDLEDAEKNLKAAEADLSGAKLALDNSIITAPFDGIIDNINVNEGDIVSNIGSGNNNIGRFIDLKSVEVRAHLSQLERNQVVGSREAMILKDNNPINGEITFIASSADQNTGTFLIKALADNSIDLADGEAVTLKVKAGDFTTHNIPISALMIDKDGDLSVDVLDETNQLKQYKVVVIDEDDKGIWITGLPEKCKIVLARQ